MNESEFIDPLLCAGCGKCCMYFEIFYPDGQSGNRKDQIVLSEMDRFQRLAWIGDSIIKRKVIGGWMLRFDIPCRHLLIDENELYRCEIYDSPDRPLLCRTFPYGDSTREDCPNVRGGEE